jgi:hypothetical protein
VLRSCPGEPNPDELLDGVVCLVMAMRAFGMQRPARSYGQRLIRRHLNRIERTHDWYRLVAVAAKEAQKFLDRLLDARRALSHCPRHNQLNSASVIPCGRHWQVVPASAKRRRDEPPWEAASLRWGWAIWGRCRVRHVAVCIAASGQRCERIMNRAVHHPTMLSPSSQGRDLGLRDVNKVNY